MLASDFHTVTLVSIAEINPYSLFKFIILYRTENTLFSFMILDHEIVWIKSQQIQDFTETL